MANPLIDAMPHRRGVGYDRVYMKPGYVRYLDLPLKSVSKSSQQSDSEVVGTIKYTNAKAMIGDNFLSQRIYAASDSENILAYIEASKVPYVICEDARDPNYFHVF